MTVWGHWLEPGEPLSWETSVVSCTGSRGAALENLRPLCLCFPCSLEPGSAPRCPQPVADPVEPVPAMAACLLERAGGCA